MDFPLTDGQNVHGEKSEENRHYRHVQTQHTDSIFSSCIRPDKNHGHTLEYTYKNVHSFQKNLKLQTKQMSIYVK